MLLILLAILLLLIFLPNQTSSIQSTPCGPHKWSIRESDNKYVCQTCGFISGTFESDNGNY